MLHSCYLIDMNRWKSDKIQFWPRIDRYTKELPEWPLDDNIYFSGMMRLINSEMFIDNSLWAGWFPYPVQSGILQNEVLYYGLKSQVIIKHSDRHVRLHHYGDEHRATSRLEYSAAGLIRRPSRVPARHQAGAVWRWRNICH